MYANIWAGQDLIVNDSIPMFCYVVTKVGTLTASAQLKQLNRFIYTAIATTIFWLYTAVC